MASGARLADGRTVTRYPRPVTDLGHVDNERSATVPVIKPDPVATHVDRSPDVSSATPDLNREAIARAATATGPNRVASSRIQRAPHNGAAPAVSDGVDYARVQRATRNAAVPAVVGRADSSRIQRVLSDGAAPALSALPAVLTAAGFRTSSRVRTARRSSDGELKQIDKWLEQAEGATTGVERNFALDQVYDACKVWERKHADDKKGGSGTVKARRPHIIKLRKLLATYPRQRQPEPARVPDNGAPAEDDNAEQAFALAGILDAVADSSGITGDYGDINLGTTSVEGFDSSDHDSMSRGGGGSINNQYADMAEGANAIAGIFGIAQGFRDLDEAEDGWERAEATGNTLASTGKMIHGAYKVSKGIAIESAGGADASDSYKKSMTQVGDIGAAYADGLGTVASFIGWMKSIRDTRKKSKEQGGLTKQETAETTAEIASNTLSVAQGGTKTALDITKAVTQVGATETIVALSTAAAAIGLVVGTIETARGGMQMYRGWSAKKTIASTRAAQKSFLAEFHISLAGAMDETVRLAYNAEIDAHEFGDLFDEWERLEAVYAELETVVRESDVAFEALRKLQNRQMEQGAVKMAQGVTSIVSGALLLSGVGAPIAIGVAAVAGIIALSYAGVGLARNSAASTLIELARRLSDDGAPKAKPDDEPSYRLMTRRVENAYYNNLRSVLENNTPFGFTDTEFRTVEQFVWDDKKDRLRSEDRNICDDWQTFGQLTREQQKASWIQVGRDDNAKKEKPKGGSKASRAIRPSAHKSSQAMESNKLEVAEALWKLGSGTFDGTAFVVAPVTLQGDVNDVGDRDVVKELQAATAQGLLEAADITASRWKAWWDDARVEDGKDDRDQAKMIKHIVDHLR